MTSNPWYTSPGVIVKKPLEFFPARGMSPAERLNSMVRFVMYASIAISYYRADPVILGMGLAAILVLSIIFAVPETMTKKCTPQTPGCDDKEKKCTAPTEDNPFMNVLAHEFGKNKPAACPTTTSTLAQSNKYFDQGLPREISDVYHNRASDRQFLTMPVAGNNGTPDTLAFRNFLYGETSKGPKCK